MHYGSLVLVDLLAQGRKHDCRVAFSPTQKRSNSGPRNVWKSWSQFCSDVSILSEKIAQHSSGDWLVFDQDAYAIAVGVMGVLYAGRTVVLPNNFSPGHLKEISAQLNGITSNLAVSAGELPIVPIYRHQHGEAPTRETSQPYRAIKDDALVKLFTSGSTGAPEIITKPFRCLAAEAEGLETAFGAKFDAQCRKLVLLTVQSHHIYGLLFGVLWPLAAGRPFHSKRIESPEEVGRFLAAQSGVFLATSPSFLRRVDEVLDFAPIAESESVLFSSGGALPKGTAASYNSKLVVPIVEVYGSTETGGIAHRQRNRHGEDKPWQPLSDVIVTQEGDEQRLGIRSSYLPSDDVFMTNDRGLVHADGRFTLLSRIDRIVKLEETRVSLDEIEKRIEAVPMVDAARALVVATGESARQSIGVVIVPSESGWRRLQMNEKSTLKADILGAIKPYLNSVVLPRKWRFVRRLPVTDNGKFSHLEMLALFETKPHGRDSPLVVSKETEANSIDLRLRIDNDLECFRGHFADVPVTPGVAQLNWAVGFAYELFKTPMRVSAIKALKFHRVITPPLTLDLNLSINREARKLNFRYSEKNRTVSSGSIQYSDPK